MAIDQKDYEKVKGILDEALMKLSKLEASKDSNSVYHITLPTPATSCTKIQYSLY